MDKIGTGATVPRTALPKIVIGLVITTAKMLMAANSVIGIGMEATVRSSARLAMTCMGITRVM